MRDYSILNQSNLNGSALNILRSKWQTAKPFPFVVIDNFCQENALNTLVAHLPTSDKLSQSKDYIFAKNKFEKNEFNQLNTQASQLYSDFVSVKFQSFLRILTGREVFVDPSFHGGGLHMGGEGSYLDMHADFNIHPIETDWLRELNILLYLNPNWHEDFGGQLKFRHAHTGERCQVEPLFNRAVIMLTKEHTLHGYDPIKFPENMYRTSIAGYAYSIMPELNRPNPYSTRWHSEHGFIKKIIGPYVSPLVRLKNRVFGSGSRLNK